MTSVRIAELKSRLSAYLHRVRRGHEVVVLDRATPIARIVPVVESGGTLTIRKPLATTSLRAVALPPPLPISGDIVALLLDERQEHR